MRANAGGEQEGMLHEYGREKVFLAHRKGFVKCAHASYRCHACRMLQYCGRDPWLGVLNTRNSVLWLQTGSGVRCPPSAVVRVWKWGHIRVKQAVRWSPPVAATQVRRARCGSRAARVLRVTAGSACLYRSSGAVGELEFWHFCKHPVSARPHCDEISRRFTAMPFQVPIHVVVGKPIICPSYVGKAAPPDVVDKWHGVYVNALRALFDSHKARYGYGDRVLEVL